MGATSLVKVIDGCCAARRWEAPLTLITIRTTAAERAIASMPESVCHLALFLNLTSSERRETVPCRSSCARRHRPLFREDKFQTSAGHRSVRQTAPCPPHRLLFPRTSLEVRDFEE